MAYRHYNRCPVYQCGARLHEVVRDPPTGTADDWPDGYPGDEQRPDLVCNDCRAVYRMIGWDRGNGKIMPR
ncbi:MAG: hypothetical protein WC683_05050 [bacterium]